MPRTPVISGKSSPFHTHITHPPGHCLPHYWKLPKQPIPQISYVRVEVSLNQALLVVEAYQVSSPSLSSDSISANQNPMFQLFLLELSVWHNKILQFSIVPEYFNSVASDSFYLYIVYFWISGLTNMNIFFCFIKINHQISVLYSFPCLSVCTIFLL